MIRHRIEELRVTFEEKLRGSDERTRKRRSSAKSSMAERGMKIPPKSSPHGDSRASSFHRTQGFFNSLAHSDITSMARINSLEQLSLAAAHADNMPPLPATNPKRSPSNPVASNSVLNIAKVIPVANESTGSPVKLPRIPSLDKNLNDWRTLPLSTPPRVPSTENMFRAPSLSNLAVFGDLGGSSFSRESSFQNLSSMNNDYQIGYGVQLSRNNSTEKLSDLISLNKNASNEISDSSKSTGIIANSSLEDIFAFVKNGQLHRNDLSANDLDDGAKDVALEQTAAPIVDKCKC